MPGKSQHTNKLIHETSPYLLQHAHNPVEWYPWGKEALDRARVEQKPILISIGYSACHWCHVMERESFENEEIAALMNKYFINIKVDREERPDLDQIYQMAVQMFTGRGGGWPLTMFLTPDGKPFYGGTYFPPRDRYNIPGFPRVLTALAEAYKEKQEEVQKTTQQIVNGLKQISLFQHSQEDLSQQAVSEGAQFLLRHMDAVYGGMSGAPKFPGPMTLSLLLRYHRLSGDENAFSQVKLTLKKMAEGGIYDHLGGGFHRYSVDAHWLVPHFEKMLYDNAQLIKVYLEAYQATGDTFFKRIAEESLAYVQREMTSPEGGFYATQDADSEGEEGKFFVWTPAEIMEILGEESGRIFCRYYDVTNGGNFEGKNILHTELPLEVLAQEFNRSTQELEDLLSQARQKVFEVRERRVKPFRDEKILTAWNALMISAAAEAYKVTRKEVYLQMATRAAGFIQARLCQGGSLLSVFKDGVAKFPGYLDDYAYLTAALLDLYEATGEQSYLEQADRLARTLIEQFWDGSPAPDGSGETGGFYFTGKDHSDLIARTKSSYDHSIPSGNSVAALDLLRLHHLTGETDYAVRAERILKLFYASAKDNPFGHASLLSALDFYLDGPKEIVVVGEKSDPKARELAAQVHSLYLPNKTVSLVDPSQPASGRLPAPVAEKIRDVRTPTAYVCHHQTCSPPVTEKEALRNLLADGRA